MNANLVGLYPDGFNCETHRKLPICGVLAVAIAANVSYPVAFEACRNALPPTRKRFRGPTYLKQQIKALQGFGYSVILVKTVQFRTISDFCQAHCDDGFVYHIHIKGHVYTFKNGLIIDQGKIQPWQSYSVRKRAFSVYRIEKLPWGVA